MSSFSLSSPKTILPAIGIALMLGAAVWAFVARPSGPLADSTLPPELSVEALRQVQANDPGRIRQTMRETFQNQEFTGEQRAELRRNMRVLRNDMMNERVDEFYASSAEDENAVLDAHIDEFKKRMDDWQKRREEQKKEEGASDRDAENHRRRFAQRTKSERKSQSESRNPDDTARQMIYFSALRARMAERGIQMPSRGGGSGRGGPGRGPAHP